MIQKSHFWAYIQRKLQFEKIQTPSMIIAALFTIIKPRKHPNCPSTDEYIKLMWYIYQYISIDNGVLLGHKKE